MRRKKNDNYKKAIGGSFAAICALIIAQLIAQLLASLLVLIKIPTGICNIIAGILYLAIAFILIKALAEKILKLDLIKLGMPKFLVKAEWILTAIILPVAVVSVYIIGFDGALVSSNMTGNQIFDTLSAGIFFTGIAAGFVEEMVFRGVILNLLKERWNTVAAVLVPSVIFGFLHVLGMDFTIESSLLVIAAGSLVGIMFSLIALRSGSVWNSAVVHAIWNIVIIGGDLTIADKLDEYSVMTYVLSNKSFAVTGGEFGIESSLIALIAYASVSIIILISWKKHKS